MWNKGVVLSLAVLVAGAAPARAALGERHVERAGGFSYCPPEGWSVREFPGFKYKFAFGPAWQGFTANLNVVDEAYDGTLKAYVDLNVVNLKKMIPGFRQIERVPFKTLSGLSGERIRAEDTQSQRELRQSFYLIASGKGRMFVLTGTSLASDGPKFDSLFDDSADSFRLGK